MHEFDDRSLKAATEMVTFMRARDVTNDDFAPRFVRFRLMAEAAEKLCNA